MTDWREAARGIPVWIGASVVNDLGGEAIVTFPPGSESDATEVWVAYAYDDGSGGGDFIIGAAKGEVTLNLEHPDTRTAYDRRLALALGADPMDVEEGVMVWYDFPYLRVFAGVAWYWGAPPAFSWREDVDLGTVGHDGLTARALAWPADKRVKS
jgi:hypothetical protein